MSLTAEADSIVQALVTEPEPAVSTGALLAKAQSENFPVASRLLPSSVREHLLATYAYARFIDDVGDLAPGDRLARLDAAEAELDRALADHSDKPVFGALAKSAHGLGLGRDPYLALIDANRMDQAKSRYEDFEELADYCALSANPIGRIVLAIFKVRAPRAIELSDRICTGLQLVEHWQDLAEDFALGRVYLPQQDLRSFKVPESDLAQDVASDRLRRLMAFEVHRASQLIESGKPLLALLPRFGRVAVAGFIAGGLAQAARIEALGYDTLANVAKASKRAVAAKTIVTLFGEKAVRR